MPRTMWECYTRAEIAMDNRSSKINHPGGRFAMRKVWLLVFVAFLSIPLFSLGASAAETVKAYTTLEEPNAKELFDAFENVLYLYQHKLISTHPPILNFFYRLLIESQELGRRHFLLIHRY